MIKKTFLKSFLLLLCMIVGGASSAWADETYSFTPNQSTTGSDATTYITTLTEFTYNKISWKMNQWNPKTLQVKTNQNSAASEFRFYNTSAFPERIKQVVITFSALTVSDASKLMFLGGTSEVTATTGGTAGTWNSTTKTLTWTPGSSDNYTYFAFYQNGKAASGTNNLASSDAIVVTYESAASATALAVKTAPTKVNYKIGETLDLTGLVLDATVGGNHVDVTSGYTASPANGATLNSVGAQTITFTYGGQNTTQTIHVGDLESIALTTTGVKTTYDEGQTFNPENLVVTATYSDGEDTPTTWTEDVTASCTYDPDGALETTDDKVTVSYEWASVTKTADIALTVNAASAYTVTFNDGTGSCATESLTEASAKAGVTLPTATIGVTGWSFAGWATASIANTEDEPTLYAAGATYNPTEDCTLYAVYQFSEKSSTDYVQATSLSEITGASSIVIVNGSYALDNTLGGSVSAPAVTDGIMTPASKFIFTLSGDNTDGFTLTNGTKRLGAVSSSNVSLATDASNYLWTFAKIGETTNFNVLSKSVSGEALERYKPKNGSYNWKTYTSDVTDIYQMKIYVPATVTVYNSNPAAMVDPTIAWTTSGDKTLYLKNTNTYDNAANVTGIAKTPVYTSSDETVATVTPAGEVTALKAGSTTIKATVEAEMGVNTKAEVSYVVTVKDASDIAGIKAITSTSTVVEFTADLIDAVVTYIKGSHAFIQDASGAIYASCGSSLTAGKKINGAVSGSVKAANQIDEITVIDLSSATVTDGVIPGAAVITAATLAANKADYEGKLVNIAGATVTASLANGSASGGKISDDSKVTEINLYAPDSNIEALKDAEGTFNGYITLYSGSTVRFNIFEQSQITLTKNAPTAQPLTFASDAVELDEDTDDYDDFEGQTVSGAVGVVTYSIVSDDDEVVTSINATTGAVVLSGNYGTATIKATAAAKEVTEAGVTTPYTATEKTYTVGVYPRYSVTFSENGVETVLREATHGAGVAVPTPAAIIDHKFIGWSTVTVATTDTKPSLASLSSTITPSDNTQKYYAVYALEKGTPVVEHTSTFTVKQASAPSSPYVNDGSSWTWSNVTFANSASAYMGPNSTISFTLPSGGKAVSLEITSTTNTWAGSDKVVVNLTDNSSNDIKTFTTSSLSYDFTSAYDHATSYTLTAPSANSKNAWVDHITFEYTTGGTVNVGYTTTVESNVDVTLPAAIYATRSYNRSLDFSDTGIKVYTVKVNAETSTAKLTELKSGQVPAYEGVILYAEEAGSYPVPVIESAAALDNDLVGVTENTAVPWQTGDKYNYILQRSGSNYAFNKANGAMLAANRAYLQTTYNATSPGARLTLVFDDDTTTGISDASRVDKEGKGSGFEIYNLKGQRVENPVKGQLYIVNGKKVVMK